MTMNALPDQEQKLVVLSIGHAHTLAEECTRQDNYIELYEIAELVLNSANMFGRAAEYHNLSAEYARHDDYFNAFRIVEKGLNQYPNNIDLLADAIHYGSYCGKITECEKYKVEMKARPRGAWNWRAFTFLIDYLQEQAEMAPIEKVMPLLDEALEIAAEYQRMLPLEEKGYIAEYEVRILRQRYIRESTDPNAVKDADAEYCAAKSALKKALNNDDVVAVQCALSYADLVFEERQYEETINVCSRALEYSETQPSARISYFKYLSALSKDALIRKEKAFADLKRVDEVLSEFLVVYKIIQEPTYEKNIKIRASLLAAEANIPLPEGFDGGTGSELRSLLARLGATQ